MTGFVMRVLATAAGTLARSTMAAATETGICAMGMSRPKNTPRATPKATPRRDQCQSLGWCSQGTSQASQRLPWIYSRVGIRARRRSCRLIYML